MSAEAPQHCEQAMVWYTVGAPGVGGGWYCESCHHTVEVQPTRILRPEETR